MKESQYYVDGISNHGNTMKASVGGIVLYYRLGSLLHVWIERAVGSGGLRDLLHLERWIGRLIWYEYFTIIIPFTALEIYVTSVQDEE